MRSSPQPVDVAVQRLVDATPERLYDLVTDVTRMGEWSPETVQARWRDDRHTAAAIGVRFTGQNRLGSLRWSTSPTITAAERGRCFAFRVPGASGTTWTYTFEPAEGGTMVTEHAHQERPLPAPIRFLQRRAGVRDRAAHLQAGMIVTLDRLALAAR